MTKENDLRWSYIFTGVMLFLLTFFYITALTLGQGQTSLDYRTTATSYFLIGIVGTLVLGIMNVARVKLNLGGRFGEFRGYLINPEESPLFRPFLIFSDTLLNIIFWSAFFIGFIAFVPTFTQAVITDAPSVIGNVTYYADWVIRVILPTLAETPLFLILAQIVMSVAGHFVKTRRPEEKWNLIKQLLVGSYVLALSAFGGIALHYLIYGRSILANLSVATFWGLIIFISAITFSIVPAYVGHFINNNKIFFDEAIGVANTNILFIILFIILIIVGIIRYIYLKRGNR